MSKTLQKIFKVLKNNGQAFKIQFNLSYLWNLYYKFLCLELAWERAHNRFNKGQAIFANIQSGELRFFKIMKYVKNQDKCDMTVFNSKKVLLYK